MSLETSLQAVLLTLCPNVYPDFAPAGAPQPYITWQQIGGVATSFVDDVVPDNRSARIQVNAWAPSRLVVNAMALQIESALISSANLQARPAGAFHSTADEDLKLRGTIQDFTIWADR